MADQIKTPPAAAPVAAAADALTGTTVGRFVISKRLGAGGMGQVYGAEDTTLKRFVAIKRMAPQANSTDADRKRLLKEAQRSSALNHPNVGAIYDVVEHAGELWVVMEYIEGETLRHRLKQPISTDEFFAIATQCCEGLQAAHEKGIIHGDIKPENIMIAAGNRVKILDFGGDAFDDANAGGLEGGDFFGVVGDEAYLGDAKGIENLGGEFVGTAVGGVSELDVGFDGIEAPVLKLVSPELGHQADAAALLLLVEQNACAGLGDLAQRQLKLQTAVAAQRTEHVPGEALRMNPYQLSLIHI